VISGVFMYSVFTTLTIVSRYIILLYLFVVVISQHLTPGRRNIAEISVVLGSCVEHYCPRKR